MQLNPSEISDLIRQRIDNFEAQAEARTEGTIVSLTDGIVRIHGLENAMYVGDSITDVPALEKVRRNFLISAAMLCLNSYIRVVLSLVLLIVRYPIGRLGSSLLVLGLLLFGSSLLLGVPSSWKYQICQGICSLFNIFIGINES